LPALHAELSLTVGNYGLFVVFPHPCGPPRGQTKNEAQSNADLTSGKPGWTCLPSQTPALFRPLIPGVPTSATGRSSPDTTTPAGP
jgi:hypothetical protein